MMAIEPNRKTFSGYRGKSAILPPEREASRRGSKRDRSKIAKEAKQEETQAKIVKIALAQPHRRGSDEWGRATAVGRLILSGQVRHSDYKPKELLDAADRYLQAYNGFRWAQTRRKTIYAEWEKFAPPPRLSIRPPAPGSTRMHVAVYVPEKGEIVETPAAKRAFASIEEELSAIDGSLRAWADVERAVRDCVPSRKDAQRIEKALHYAILDEPGEDWLAPFWVIHSLSAGLGAVALFYGV
jgi:hypothetical protein